VCWYVRNLCRVLPPTLGYVGPPNSSMSGDCAFWGWLGREHVMNPTQNSVCNNCKNSNVQGTEGNEERVDGGLDDYMSYH